MEVILIVALSLFVATSDGEVFSSKDNSKSQEVEVIVIQPEPVEPEEVKPEPAEPEEAQQEPLQTETAEPEEVQQEPLQTEIAEPEEVQPEETSESNINEEGTNWLNIILYILGAILVIGTGIYFVARKQTITPLSAAGSPRQEQPQKETQSEPQVQEQPQEETQSSENTEDDSSENNNK